MIWEKFLSQVDQRPDETALCLGERCLSYLELASLVEALALRLFGAGPVERGRALIHQSDPLTILLYVLASWRAGVTPVLVKESAPQAMVDELATWIGPTIQLLQPVALEDISPCSPTLSARPFQPREEALILNTSGTTGSPKLVALPAESVCLNAEVIAASLGFGPGQRIALNTPLTYAYGLIGGVTAGLCSGATLHLFSPRLPLSVLQGQIRKQGITVIQGPPSLLRLFVAYWNGQPFPSVQCLTTGGEPICTQLHRDLERAFPNARKFFMYGMTEAGPRISLDDMAEGRLGCVGKPFAHFEWRLEPVPDLPENVGRLVLRGPSLFLGYLQQTGEYLGLDAEGFFHASDLLAVDESGRLYFHGRLDRLFRSGGKLVDPAAIERLLARFPGVRTLRCRPQAHPILGFVPVLEVVIDGSQDFNESAMRQHCELHLDAPSVPSQIRIVEEIPVAASGKSEL